MNMQTIGKPTAQRTGKMLQSSKRRVIPEARISATFHDAFSENGVLMDQKLSHSAENRAAVLSDLARVKALFQLRTIAMHIGAPVPVSLLSSEKDR